MDFACKGTIFFLNTQKKRRKTKHERRKNTKKSDPKATFLSKLSTPYSFYYPLSPLLEFECFLRIVIQQEPILPIILRIG